MGQILKLFRERLRGERPKTVAIEPSPNKRAGVTHLDKAGEPVKVEVPVGEDAEGRTIRLHEALHATFPPLKLQPGHHKWTQQAIEDARLHLHAWPTGFEGVNRDAAAVVVKEARVVGQQWEKIAPEMMPIALASLVRGSATVASLTKRKLHTKKDHWAYADRAREKIPRAIREAVGNVVQHVQRMEFELAASLLDTLMKALSEEKPRGEESLEERGRSGEEAFTPSAEGSEADGEKDGKATLTPPQFGPPRTPPVYSAGPSTTGRAPRMRLHELHPRHEPTELAKGRARRPAAAGMRLRAKKLSFALANNRAQGLFLRRAKRFSVAGTVLIDASGSMGVTPQKLLLLLKCAPGATIAYYNSPDEVAGTLFVAARNGKLFSGEKLPFAGSGNGVDLEALQWLLRQRGPRVFVTDGGFTGYPDEPPATMALLENAGRLHLVTQLGSLHSAILYFLRARNVKKQVHELLEGFGLDRVNLRGKRGFDWNAAAKAGWVREGQEMRDAGVIEE